MAARLPAGVCPPHAARLGRRRPPWRTGAPDAVRGPPALAAVWPFKRSPAPPAVPGVSFVDSLANPGATVDAAAVAALWRDAAPMPCVSGDSDARVATALGRLIDLDEMGTLFQAIAIAHPDLPTPAGFET